MKNTNVSSLWAFKTMAFASLVIGILTVLLAVLAYLPGNPDFSILNTYLSDIGDTDGWPQIIFNNGTILAAPLRMIVIVLLLLVLRRYEGPRPLFEALVLFIGFVSVVGTVCMTAVPYSSAPVLHKVGIGLYFLGVVFLQSLVGFRELKIEALPQSLTILSFLIVSCFVFFLTSFILLQTGLVSRSLSVFWEWMCFFSSMIWLFGHGILLTDEKFGFGSRKAFDI